MKSAVSGKRLRRSDGAVSTTVLSQTAIRPGVSELLASEKLDRVEEKVRRAAAQAQRDQAKRKDPPRESRAIEPQQGSNGRRPRAGADANGWSPQQKDVLQVKMTCAAFWRDVQPSGDSPRSSTRRASRSQTTTSRWPTSRSSSATTPPTPPTRRVSFT